jgi:hypothetical protein
LIVLRIWRWGASIVGGVDDPAYVGRKGEERAHVLPGLAPGLADYRREALAPTEIGGELYLSLSTVETHMRHICAKLGVHRRTAAVEQCELRLLALSARRR